MQSVRHTEPGLVFKAAGSNALIHEGTGCTDSGAHDHKSTAGKLLGGNNTDRRGAYVYIQRASAREVCTFCPKHIPHNGRAQMRASSSCEIVGRDEGGGALICAAVKLNILLLCACVKDS